jgi:putative intracellular protease/amidase
MKFNLSVCVENPSPYKAACSGCEGLILTPEVAFSEAPPLDVLVVPGDPGQVDLMEDEVMLSFIRKQAAGAKLIFSVCRKLESGHA